MNIPEHINLMPSERVLFVCIDNSYKCKDKSSIYYRDSLYDATRMYWRLSADKLDKITLVIGYAEGIVREVIRPLEWHLTANTKYLGRYECTGDEIKDSEYIGKCVLNLFKPGQNPVKYINL